MDVVTWYWDAPTPWLRPERRASIFIWSWDKRLNLSARGNFIRHRSQIEGCVKRLPCPCTGAGNGVLACAPVCVHRDNGLLSIGKRTGAAAQIIIL